MNDPLLDSIRQSLSDAGLAVVPVELYQSLLTLYGAAATADELGSAWSKLIAGPTTDENHQQRIDAWRVYSVALDAYDAALKACTEWHPEVPS